MSSFFNCAAYDDVDSTIRLDDNVIFLAFKVKAKDSDIHITLNPFQARILAKYLSLALSKIEFKDLTDENHFGGLTVCIEQESPQEEKENYAVAVPF